jgi:hypothetical protein
LVTEECCNCGIVFAMPTFLERRAREDNEVWFYCPNGHKQHYTTSEVDRVRKLLEQANAQNTRLASDLKAEHDARQKAERLVARVKRGICPCCNRMFANVARHMASKHKDQQ